MASLRILSLGIRSSRRGAVGRSVEAMEARGLRCEFGSLTMVLEAYHIDDIVATAKVAHDARVGLAPHIKMEHVIDHHPDEEASIVSLRSTSPRTRAWLPDGPGRKPPNGGESEYASMQRFKDRRDAGRRLADELSAYRDSNTIVLGLPRGGVPVAFEVAKALRLPLDVLVVRKLGAPGQPELAVGAVAQGGIVVRNDDVIADLHMDDEAIEVLVEQKRVEVEDRVRRFRGGGLLPDVKGKTVILVDNGVATGSTILAGAQAVRIMNPARLVIAVPVVSPRVLERLQEAADEVVVLVCREDFHAVGQWYDDFSQTSDKDVVALLHKARAEAVH